MVKNAEEQSDLKAFCLTQLAGRENVKRVIAAKAPHSLQTLQKYPLSLELVNLWLFGFRHQPL